MAAFFVNAISEQINQNSSIFYTLKSKVIPKKVYFCILIH